MTAEVVVMNKQGIAMAADSAVTSGRDGVKKVFHSANKLFSVSKEHPVGLMVYGAASFMEVPWEVIIKAYRDQLGSKKYSTLKEYADDLMAFLQKDPRFYNEAVEDIIVYRIFSDHMKRLAKRMEEKIFQEKAKGNEITSNKVSDWLSQKVNNKVASYKKEKYLLHMDYDLFIEKYHTVIDEVTNEFVEYDVPNGLMKQLYILGFEAVQKDYFSVGSTGLVISGYGEDDIFPRTLNYRLEGLLFGDLKYKELKERTITYTSESNKGTAAIMPFAQRDMMDAFIRGIEHNVEDVIFGILSKVVHDYPSQIQKHLPITLTEEQTMELEEMGNDLYNAAEQALRNYQEENYIEPLLGIVRALPKEELADMAETLISLSSFKSRVSQARESVGPPIDVAIITKVDGFVWMKRKNYIDTKINERL